MCRVQHDDRQSDVGKPNAQLYAFDDAAGAADAMVNGSNDNNAIEVDKDKDDNEEDSKPAAIK